MFIFSQTTKLLKFRMFVDTVHMYNLLIFLFFIIKQVFSRCYSPTYGTYQFIGQLQICVDFV